MSSGPEYHAHGVRYGPLLDHRQNPSSPIMTAQPMTMPTMITKQPAPSKRQANPIITVLLVVALVVLMIVSLIEGAFFLMIMRGSSMTDHGEYAIPDQGTSWAVATSEPIMEQTDDQGWPIMEDQQPIKEQTPMTIM